MINPSKTVIVTGCNRGIGYGIIENFAIDFNDGNWRVIATARNEKQGQETLNALISQYPKIKDHFVFHQLDVTDVENIKKFKEFVIREYINFDILINNAGVSVCETGDEENLLQITEDTFSVNVYGSVRMSENLLDIINEGGKIINVSSRYGIVKFKDEVRRNEFLDIDRMTREKFEDLRKQFFESSKNHSWEKDGWINEKALDNVYSLSKMFLNVYTRILARELKQQGRNIKVNACHPGWCQTEMGGSNAARTYLEGGSVPFFLANFTSERDDSLSGNFYFEKTLHNF